MDSNGNTKHEAFCTFMRRHQETVWRVCWRFAGQKGNNTKIGYDDRLAHAKDLAQEVWIVLWQKFDQLNPNMTERQQRKWLERLAESTIIDLFRREKPSPESLTDVMTESIADNDSTPFVDEIEELMSILTPDEKKLMRLHIEGYHGDEIAEIMGIKRNAVYLRIHRAVSKARRVVLVVLMAAVASAIAVTVVPQWREWVFPHLVKKESPLEEPVEQPERLVSVIDTIQKTVIDTPDWRQPMVPLQPIPHLYEVPNSGAADSDSASRPIISASNHTPCGCPDNHVRRHQSDNNDSINDPCEPTTETLPEVTISVNGNIVVVEGADNEMVSVFDGQGRLVARTQCHGYCMLTITSDTPSVRGSNPSPYWVQVGARQSQQVFLSFPNFRIGF